MFEKIIRFSLQRSWLLLMLVAGMAVLGVYSYKQLPIDAVPDITNVQVQINTVAPGYSPLEAEQRITYPIETALAGLPRLEQRSEEHTSELQSLMRISYAVICLKKKKINHKA